MAANHEWFLNHGSVEPDKALAAAEKLDDQVREIADGQRKPGKLSMEELALVLSYVRHHTQVK